MTTFEHRFETEGPPSDAWARLLAAQPDELTPPAVPRRWWLPGFESTGEELDLTDGEQLTVRKDRMPCEDTTITFTFEHAPSGTRITVVQSGFDEAFIDGAGEAFWITAEAIAADVELFFRHGVVGGRHARPWAWLGLDTTATPMGLEITSVVPDTWAARAGIETGDILLTLGGAPIVSTRDLVTVTRLVPTGAELTVTRSHGRELLSGTAVL